MKRKRHTYGGKRVGAGRPKGEEPPRKIVSFTINVELIEKLENYCEKVTMSKSEAVNNALISYLNSNKQVVQEPQKRQAADFVWPLPD